MNEAAHRQPRAPRLGEALFPIGCLMLFLGAAVINLNDLPEIHGVTTLLTWLGATPYFGAILYASIPVHIPMIGATAVAALQGMRLGWKWRDIEESFKDGIRLSLSAVLILLLVGVLIGTWIASGVVPLMIVCGLDLLSPDWFLFAACLICAIVALATGSSWTTAGTVGVALIGIGGGLGVPLPLVAGSIISGAYFGDKMSPLSDTTNLAPAVAGSELFEHVRHMMLTSGPSFLVSLILFFAIGNSYGAEGTSWEQIETMVGTLNRSFDLNAWLWLAPVLVIGMVVMRVPALPALFVGAGLGGLFASLFQGMSLSAVLTVTYDGFTAETGVAAVDDLLTRGGVVSMYGTIGIIICAMSFGGVMEKCGMLESVAAALLGVARGTTGLIWATLGTCVGINVIASDQYLSIVVPGRMYRSAYEKAGLHPKNLSRCLEDAGTLTSPLVPWNSCGAFMYATLGVFPLAYLPFAFFNLLNPLISALYGYTGWTIEKAGPTDLSDSD